jgi:DNA-binding response OmpR family regulator
VLRRADGRSADAGARVAGDDGSLLVIADVEVDRTRREVRQAGTVVALTHREFDLLAHLVECQGQVLSRAQLIEGVWGHDWVGDERTVDVHVRQLRRKLGADLPLATVWGVGYRMG